MVTDPLGPPEPPLIPTSSQERTSTQLSANSPLSSCFLRILALSVSFPGLFLAEAGVFTLRYCAYAFPHLSPTFHHVPPFFLGSVPRLEFF